MSLIHKNQLKVLHVLPTRKLEYGGPVVVAEALVEQLNQLGIEASIYPTSNEDPRVLKSVFELSDAVRNCDLLHIHGLWNKNATIAAIIARASDKPYIVTPHGMLDKWALGKSKYKKKIYSILFEKKNISHAAKLHFLNIGESEEAKFYGAPFNFFILPNGVFLNKYLNLPKRKIFEQSHPKLKGKVLSLFLGRLHPKKGLGLLIPAFKNATETVPNLHLLIAGPDQGGYKSQLELLVKKYQLEDFVTFLGMVKDESKLSVLGAADLFILPSYQEGDSIAIKEAMASKLPVIITEACHFPEVASSNAGLIVDGDISQISQSLISLSTNEKLRNEMGTNALALIGRLYSWEKIGEQFKIVYENEVKDFVNNTV